MANEYYGRMTDPSVGAWHTGPCGDTMEFYLVIEEDMIRKARYYTEGCQYTRLCGQVVAQYVEGKTLTDALAISAKYVLDQLPQLPVEHHHCPILAVLTFYKTVGQFWVEVAGS